MTLEDIERVKRAVIRKYPISAGLALRDVKIELTTEIETAAVACKKNEFGKSEVKALLVNPDFFGRLTFSERVFVLAHEACHISLKHFSRALNKPEKDAQRKYQEYCKIETNEQKRKIMKQKLQQRYHNIWNIATDACINAFLKRDGLTFPNNVIDPSTGEKMEFIDMEEGSYKSAEKIYDYLVKKYESEQEEKSNNKQNGSSDERENSNIKQQNSDNSSKKTLDNVDLDNYKGIDSHKEWTEETNGQEKATDKDLNEENDEKIDEESVFDKEIKEREKKRDKSIKDDLAKVRGGDKLGNYISQKPVISWKTLLVRSLENTEEVWGTRRSSRFNPNPRIEERIYESLPSVEVILDTSGSISSDLLKGFLMQLCSLFESIYGDEVQMKVGYFSDNFSGFSIIKNKNDILNYNLRIGGGTNFEVAATSFSKDPGKKTTKIVFTDGMLGIPQRTRVTDICWLVFGDNMNFIPLGGRIIKVSQEEVNKMMSNNNNYVNASRKRR